MPPGPASKTATVSRLQRPVASSWIRARWTPGLQSQSTGASVFGARQLARRNRNCSFLCSRRATSSCTHMARQSVSARCGSMAWRLRGARESSLPDHRHWLSKGANAGMGFIVDRQGMG